MLFNSYEFIFIFLPLTFFIYFYLNNKRLTQASKGFLVFASLFFYSWWNIAYLPLILISMLFNYIIGNSLNKKPKKNINNNETNNIKENKTFSNKTLLAFGIVANLSMLAYFKYADFFIENINTLSGTTIQSLNLLLPLAISFFTFQQIAYLVDSYRNETKEYDFLNYALFVTFFPQLIAGPIVHHKEMMPQFASKWNLVKKYKNIALGLFIFSIGLFKKVVIADTFAVWATAGFDTATTLNLFEAWATSLSYTFQLYFDFSGYTDMAIGAALLFNIKLPINFNSPYKAKNIQEFWRRWHITLSRFLRDYVYIPLGGNKVSSFRTYSNLLATFVIGGLWHGAGWTFIFWGFLHGIALIIHRAWNNFGFKMYSWLAWFITFNFVNVAWVFFRAKEWKDAVRVLSSMFSLENVVLPLSLQNKINFLNIHFAEVYLHSDGGNKQTVWLLFGFLIALVFKNSMEYRKIFKLNYFFGIFFIILFLTGILNLTRVSEFLYFNF